MTGLHPQEHGFNRAPGSDPGRPLRSLDTSVTTLAEHLHGFGYRTAAIATNPFLHGESGIMQGFERFETLEDGTAKLPLMTALRVAGVIETELYQDAVRVRQRLGKLTGFLGREEDRPFFLWLHLMDPHRPLRAHRGLSDDPAAAELPQLDRLYRDEARYALREAAKMFELLQQRGLWEDTAVLIVSDHGEMMLSDQRFRGVRRNGRQAQRRGHGHALYDELVRVPLVIRAPGAKVARQVDTLASHVDIVYTATDLLGVERMKLPEGRVSLVPWLDGRKIGRVERPFALVGSLHFDASEQRGLRSKRFKLIEHTEDGSPSELYHLGRDAGERENLAKKRPLQVERLRQKLDERWEDMLPPLNGDMLEIDEETRKRLEALGYL